MWYIDPMTISATDFRKNLFQLIDNVSNGELVEVSHKGRTLRLVPVDRPSKLARLPKRDILVGTPEDVDHALDSVWEENVANWETKWHSK